MSKFLTITICLILALFVFIRFYPAKMADFHVDPKKALRSNSKNYYITEFTVAGTLKEELPIPNLPDEHVRLFAGSLEAGFATFETRTRVLGFPDYVSITVEEQENKTLKLNVFSRSRFGYYDFGRNKQRVRVWKSAIEEMVGT